MMRRVTRLRLDLGEYRNNTGDLWFALVSVALNDTHMQIPVALVGFCLQEG